MTRSLAAALGAVAALSCARVPEQQLRDEQAKARRYRDAYESTLQENAALKKRLAEARRCEDAAAPSAGSPAPDAGGEPSRGVASDQR